ncbi:MAG: small subunit ribosomal protein [Patescibacteria group bacterium]|nr:small subunit ribosomal protein [Patescibacteria group bacterium]
MPITKSAKKELRKGANKRVFNELRKKNIRDTVKVVKKSLVAKNPADAEKNLAAAYQAIDKAAKRGVIKKNAANRKKSRLAAAIRKAKEIK